MCVRRADAMTHTVLIVAGGKGLRMGSGTLPKQFLPIG